MLEAVHEWIAAHGYPPTIRELGKLLGIKSLRGVTSHLDALARKGCLTRSAGARGIRVLSGAAWAVRIPIIGRVAAGKPLLAEEHLEGHLLIDPALVKGERHFALRVKGDSMVEAGILDGDYVIVRSQSDAEDGTIVAVRLGDEATVKRFFKASDRIRLEPAHPALEPIVLSKDQPIDLLGKVVGVFRTY